MKRIAWPGLFFLIWAALVYGTPPRQDLREPIRLAIDARYAEALVQFEELLQKNSDDPLLHYYVGLCHFYLKETRKARRFLEQSIEKKAAFPEAYFWLAQVYLVEDMDGPALQVLERGVKRFPTNKKLTGLLEDLKQKLESRQAAKP